MPLARVDPDLKPLGYPPPWHAYRDSTLRVVGPESSGDVRGLPLRETLEQPCQPSVNGGGIDPEGRRPLVTLAYDARRGSALL
jgi:hypothetical protein